MSTCTLQPPTTPTEIPRRVVIEFLYINLTTCSRCLGTDAQIEAALALVRPVLAVTGIEVELRKILVESEAQARALRFASSPTIRIDGRDIALGSLPPLRKRRAAVVASPAVPRPVTGQLALAGLRR